MTARRASRARPLPVLPPGTHADVQPRGTVPDAPQWLGVLLTTPACRRRYGGKRMAVRLIVYLRTGEPWPDDHGLRFLLPTLARDEAAMIAVPDQTTAWHVMARVAAGGTA